MDVGLYRCSAVYFHFPSSAAVAGAAGCHGDVGSDDVAAPVVQ